MRSNFSPRSGRGVKGSIREITRRTPSRRVISANIGQVIHIETKSLMPEQLCDMQKISGAAAKIENALGPRQIEFNFANPANVDVNPAVKIEIFRPVFAWIFDGVALADLLENRPIDCFNNPAGLERKPGSVKKPAAYVFLRWLIPGRLRVFLFCD